MKEYYDNDLLQRIKTSIDFGKFDLAKSLIDEYKEKYPDDGMIKYLTVRYYNFTKQYEKAYNYCFDQIGTKFRTNRIMSHFYCEFSITLLALGLNEEAVNYLEYAVNYTNGEENRLICQLLDAYSINGEYQKAIQVAQKYKNYDNESEINLAMTKIHYLNSEYELSIKCALETNDSKIKNTQIQKKYYNLGKSYYEIGDQEEAIKAFKKVLILKNDYYYLAYFLLAKIYVSQNNLEEAARILEDIVKANRGGTDVNNLLSNVYGALNNPDRLTNINKYLNPKVIEYEKGKMCFEQLDFLSAIKHFENYINNHGTDYKKEVLYLLILSRFKANQYRQCLDDIYAYNASENQAKDILRMTFYCKFKLNEAEVTPNYTPMQIFNYDPKLASNHISGRHLNIDFEKYISYERLFEIIKKDLTPDKLNPYAAFDKYELDLKKYSNYIRDYNSESTILNVICLPGTSNILTIYTDEKTEDDDLEITQSDLNKKKKALSRIDKFNQKYSQFVS